MNISLTKEFETYVAEKVESGMYHSASEVIRDGLRLMKERDELHQSRLADLRKDIAIGVDQADRGHVRPFDEETTARVKARGRKVLGRPKRNGPGMIEPRLTEQAEADLDELWSYVAANHPDAADRIIDAILEGSRMHVRFPGMGQKRDDLRPGIRCFVVSPYVVFYRPSDDTIEVLRILHGARDLKSLLPPEI